MSQVSGNVMQRPTVAVAGGTRGIGAAVACALAQEGCNLVLGYRCDDRCANATRQRIRRLGREVVLAKGDLSTEFGTESFLSVARKASLEVSALVNCAAIRTHGSPSFAEAMAVFDRNVQAAIRCSETFGLHFRQRGGGHIVNITSTAAILPISTPGARFYAAAKGAVESYSRALAAELAPTVLVNTVAPGLVADDRTPPPAGGARSCYPDDAIPLRRRGRPEEVASLIVWLVLRNSYATGQTFVIDGGLTAALPWPKR